MSSYYGKIKWILTGADEDPPNTIITHCEQGNDSDGEYDKIGKDSNSPVNDLSSNVKNNDNNNNNDDNAIELSSSNTDKKYSTNIQTEFEMANDDFNKIYAEMIDKEQIIRERLNSKTIEQIKENYAEYIDNDIQIIKDFAVIMETFSHIKDKLKEFENNIKNFGSVSIIASETISDSSCTELNIIKTDLEKVINKVNMVDSTSCDFMNKLVHLENLIKSHETQRELILLKLEKINKEHKEIKDSNLKILNMFSNHNFIPTNSYLNGYENYFKYIGYGIGLYLCVIVGYKYLGKN